MSDEPRPPVRLHWTIILAAALTLFGAAASVRDWGLVLCGTILVLFAARQFVQDRSDPKSDKPERTWTSPLRRRSVILVMLGFMASIGVYWFGIGRRAQSKNSRIHTEMTREHVETILGTPNRTASLPGGQILCQYQGDGRTQLLVIFDHDCAVFVKAADSESSPQRDSLGPTLRLGPQFREAPLRGRGSP
jgi:hypothetical protein